MRSSILAFAALAACAAADPDPQWLTRSPVATDAAAAGARPFAVPPALQLGFDDVRDGSRLAVGDRVLFGVRMDRDDDVQVRYLRAEVASFEVEEWTIPPHSFVNDTDEPIQARIRHASVRATVFDADGTVLGEDTVRLDPQDLERGIVGACRGDALPPEYGTAMAPPGVQAQWASLAIGALRNVLRVARSSPPLRALLWQVVDVPSLFSILSHLGVKLTVAANFAGSVQDVEFAVDAATVPTWAAPIELRLNGSPALRCRVRCTDPHSPLALGAGIVEMRASSPSHPQRTVTIALLGARRGDGAGAAR